MPSLSSAPLSPHLTVYKAQVTSGVSIIGRLCGVYTYAFILLSFWLMVFSIYQYTNPFVPLYMAVMFIKTSSPLLTMLAYLLLYITTFCLTFYTGTLLRHICWDYTFCLSLKSSSIFGYIIVTSAVILSFLSVFFVAIQ